MLQKQWSCKTGIKAETAMESTCSKLGNTASYAASADTATTASFIAPTALDTVIAPLDTVIALRTGISMQHRRNQQQIRPPLPPQCSSLHQKINMNPTHHLQELKSQESPLPAPQPCSYLQGKLSVYLW